MTVRCCTFYGVILATICVWTPAAWSACAPDQGNRYVINGNTVYDKKTDLTWQRCSVGQTWKGGDVGCAGQTLVVTLDEAVTKANEVWRLPTPIELSSLLAPGCEPFAINPTAFPDVELQGHGPNVFYWTSEYMDRDGKWTSEGFYRRTKGGRVVGFSKTRNGIENMTPEMPSAVRLVKSGK